MANLFVPFSLAAEQIKFANIRIDVKGLFYG